MSVGERASALLGNIYSKYRYNDLFEEKTYRFCNLGKWKDFNKEQLTSLCVVHGPIYGR